MKKEQSLVFYRGVFATSYAFAFTYLLFSFFVFSISFRVVSLVSLLTGLFAVYEIKKIIKRKEK